MILDYVNMVTEVFCTCMIAVLVEIVLRGGFEKYVFIKNNRHGTN